MKNVLRIFRSLMPIFLTGVMLMCVVACSKDDPKDDDTNSRSVLVYISAQNSLMGNENNDIVEMLAGTSSMGEHDHLVVFVDNNNKSRIYEITRNTTATTPYNLTPVYVYDDNLNSATPLVFDRVLDYFFEHYKAKDYGLVLWSHGSGWINATNKVQQRRSFAVDTSNGTTRMLITDMADVLRKYPKFEYILFDACFMQTIEVAYEFRGAAKYIIGSPAEIPGAGAPYKQMIPALFLHDSEHKIAKDIVEAYGSYYNSETRSGGGVVLSAIRTSEFDAFVDVMAEMFDKYSFLDESKYTNCLNYYLYEWNHTVAAYDAPDEYDIQGIMMKVLISSDDYSRWENSFYKLSPFVSIGSDWYSAYTWALMPVDKSQCGAVSMYLPLEKYKNDEYFDYYKEIQWGKLFEIK